MGSRGPKFRQKDQFAKSFRVAFSGLFQAFIHERHMQYHVIAAIFVIVCGFVFDVTYAEWLVLCLVMGGVFALELVNTAIEAAVDLSTEYDHPLAKLAKDVSAAAVLFFSGMAVVIAVIIFWHHL